MSPSFSSHAERHEGCIFIVTCNGHQRVQQDLSWIRAMTVAAINCIVHHAWTQKAIAEGPPSEKSTC
jgi:hypothetical protein